MLAFIMVFLLVFSSLVLIRDIFNIVYVFTTEDETFDNWDVKRKVIFATVISYIMTFIIIGIPS